MTDDIITISAGAPPSDLTPGVYEVTLVDISEPRTIFPQTGPNAGKEVQLRDWTFALEDGTEVEDGAVGPGAGQANSSVVLLIDRSASMGALEGKELLSDRAQARARAVQILSVRRLFEDRSATWFGLWTAVGTPLIVNFGMAMGPFTMYDMAGNAREWCSNAVGGKRFVLGAACSIIAGYVGMWISIRANIRAFVPA